MALRALVFVSEIILQGLAQSQLFRIEEPRLSGDCAGSDIDVIEEDGEFYIKAFFDASMSALADGLSHDKKRCTMDFRLRVAPGWRLDLFEFGVDGVYRLSEKGTARLTVSHRAGNAPAIRTTKFFSLEAGDPPAGELGQGGFSGSVYGSQLGSSYGACGGAIPIETSVFAAVTQSAGDRSGITQLILDEGASTSKGYTLGKVKAQRCP